MVVSALCGASFEAKENDHAVFEPFGAGKSTLLHLPGGLDRPQGGHVLADPTDIFDLTDVPLVEPRMAETGFVFQFFNPLPR
jgi:putative ABC transport system ATP-binding protein